MDQQMNEMEKKKTEMTHPPKEQVAMIAPQKKGQKTYKLVVLRPFNLGKVEYSNGGGVVTDNTRITKVGDIVEVDRDQARDLCKKLLGSYSFSGERYDNDKDITRHDLSRARLATPNDLMNVKVAKATEDDIFSD